MPKTRLAIIGLGMASAPHAKSLRDLGSRIGVAAAYSPTQARRDAFSAQYGFPATDDLDGIFADGGIGAVLILTPPNSHLELVERAARAGKHILLEKPLDITLERATRLVGTAEAGAVKLAIVLQHRFRPVSLKLSEILGQGRLGTIVSTAARLGNWRPQSYYDAPGRGTYARDGGGVLLTQGIHTLDLLISFAGLPQEVTGCTATTPVHAMEAEDMAVAVMRYGNSALGTISATTCAYPGFPDMIELIGTRGTARLEGSRLTVHFHDGTTITLDDQAAGGGTGADPMAFSHEHHRAVLSDFIDAVEGGRQPRVTGREALNVHRLIDAITRSSRLRACVSLS